MANTMSPAAFAAPNMNYIIAGGGTACLVLAVRLSENPQVTVGVIEAGMDHSEDPKVLTPGFTFDMWSNPNYAWVFNTTPQSHANNRVVAQPQGKQLGGSSAINYLFWTHASQKDINDWASTSAQINTNFIDPALHGEHGPVQNAFGPYFDDFYSSWESTYRSLGLSSDGDPKGGKAIGAYSTLLSLDSKKSSRSYAANAYYKPVAARPNLKVLTRALVTKIDFAPSKKPLVATGVTFVTNGETYTAKADHEVIICAGVFQSPKLLELSGIGDKATLKQHQIEVHYHNPNVGENLQDHILVPLGFEAAAGEQTIESLSNATYFASQLAEYTKNHTGMLSARTPNAFLSFSQIKHALDESTSPILQELLNQARNSSNPQHALTLAKLFSPTEAFAQEFYLPGGDVPVASSNGSIHHYFSMLGVLEHPFSRGSVHIGSANATDNPIIDCNYFSHPLDLYLMGRIMLHLQQVARSAPLSEHLLDGGHVFQPGFYELNASNVEGFVRNISSTENHPIGTCAMGPREGGGVVDERMMVYGTQNLRVVDSSVFPLLPRGNLQTLVYAVAERAADFIREDMRK